MPDIVITEFMDEAAITQGLKGFDVHYDPLLVDKPDELKKLAGGCRALIVRNRTQVRGELLAAAPKLQAVGRLGVGLDNIDVVACAARSIKVLPATGANNVAVAEYVITAALMLLRRAWFATDRVAAGSWPRNDLIGREISAKTLGLVGFGGIAQAVTTRAQGLEVGRIIAYDPFVPSNNKVWEEYGVEPVTLDDVIAQSDIISLHVPLTERTRNLIDAGALAAMKNDAIVINAARGGVVDEPALVAALKAGVIGGAALDVFDAEPLKGEQAALFKDCPNLILTPHIAGVTEESNVAVSWVTVENVKKALTA
jgi:(S)-sulfolactate dehydrogenase